MEFRCVYHPGDDGNSFVQPIAVDKQSRTWIQVVNETDGVIKSYQEIELVSETDTVIEIEASGAPSVGKPAIYSVHLSSGVVYIGSRKEIEDRVSSLDLSGDPLFEFEISAFLNHVGRYRKSIINCGRKLGPIWSKRVAREPITQEFTRDDRSIYLHEQLLLEIEASQVVFMTPSLSNAIAPADFITSMYGTGRHRLPTHEVDAMLARADNLLESVFAGKIQVEVYFSKVPSPQSDPEYRRIEYILSLMELHDSLKVRAAPDLTFGHYPPCALIQFNDEPIEAAVAFASQARVGSKPTGSSVLEVGTPEMVRAARRIKQLRRNENSSLGLTTRKILLQSLTGSS